MNARPPTLALLLIVASASAQESEPQRVVVTGSRVPRIDAETALPVQILRREEIERSGVMNAEELLDRFVSANFGGHREAMGVGDSFQPGFSGASLRGLGAGETLVLLNGRRLASYALTGFGGQGVDLHTIPLAALERVEILKDGASAIYGSDAVAGVINFVTRSDYAGAEGSLSYEVPEARGGASRRATLALGIGDPTAQGFNVFAVIDAQHADRLRAVDRPFAATGYRPELGLDLTSPSSWPANITQADDGVPTLVNPAAPACTPQTVRKGSACWFDTAAPIDLLPRTDQVNLLARGTLALMPGAEAYAELSASHYRAQFVVAPSPASASGTVTGVRFILPASSPYYPVGLGLSDDLNLRYRTVPLGGRTQEVRSNNVRMLAGVKGNSAGWDYDAALAANDSRAQNDYVSGYVDAGRLHDALATGLVNPFGPSGAEGDALLASAELRGLARDSRSRTYSADVRANRELMSLAGGALALALGAEARRETLSDTALPLSADVAGGAYVPPKEGSRNVQAAYAELVAPLVRGFEAQLAARVDHYSDFGTSVSPKLALRAQPAHEWLLRASAGRAFRAPSLPELYTAQRSMFVELGNFGVSDPLRCPVTGLPSDCAPEVTLVDGGNPALQPQRSTQYNAGLVFEPSAAWHVSIDAWAVRLSDVITSVDVFDILDDLAAYEGRNVIRGPVDPAFPTVPGPIVRIETLNENLGEGRVSGVDVSMALRPMPTHLGRVSARLDGTYVREAKGNVDAGTEVDLLGSVAPRWQHMLSATLDRGGWSATLSQRYRRGYEDEQPLPDGSTRHVSSYQVWDAQFAYVASRHLRWTLGVKNLFDRDPPFTNQRSLFQAGYDAGYADPLGRTWTLGVSATY